MKMVFVGWSRWMVLFYFLFIFSWDRFVFRICLYWDRDSSCHGWDCRGVVPHSSLDRLDKPSDGG
jgi:hypothetical protein